MIKYRWDVPLDNKSSYENFLSSSKHNPCKFSIVRPLCFLVFPRFDINQIPDYNNALHEAKLVVRPQENNKKLKRLLVRRIDCGILIYDRKYFRYYILNQECREKIIARKIENTPDVFINEINLILALADIEIILIVECLIDYNQNKEIMDFTSRSPLKVFFEITSKCNLNCIHCSNRHSNIRSHNMKSKTVIHYLNQLYDLNVPEINITGGEPLIHPDIYKIMNHAIQLFPGLTISTNGKLLNDKILSFLKQIELRYLNISLDGTAEVHNAIRIGSDFSNIIRKIVLAKKYIDDIGVTITLNNRNIHDIENIVSTAKYYGIKKINFGIIKKSFFNENNELLIESPSVLFPLLKKISALCESNEIIYYLPSDLPYSSVFNQNYQNVFCEQISCSAGKYSIKIRSDETIVPCIYLSSIPLIKIENGDIKNTLMYLSNIYSPPNPVINAYNNSKCFCLGGCPGRFTKSTNSSMNICDKYCMKDLKE